MTAASGGGDAVCRALSYVPEDEAPDADYQFRAVIIFLPQFGVFYYRHDRHAGHAGLQGTLRAYDVSWLRLHRSESKRFCHRTPLEMTALCGVFIPIQNCLELAVMCQGGES